MNSLPKTVTRQRRSYDLNPGPSAPESSTLTTRLPSHPVLDVLKHYLVDRTLVPQMQNDRGRFTKVECSKIVFKDYIGIRSSSKAQRERSILLAGSYYRRTQACLWS